MSSLREAEQITELALAELMNVAVASSAIWEEEPVDFKTFCESPSYLGTFALSGRQYADARLLLGDDPKRVLDPNRDIDLLILAYGKGGGKDEVAARICTYVVYILLCMASPHDYLMSPQEFHLLNVAKKSRQAEGVFFKYVSRLVQESRWFRDRFDIQVERKWFHRVQRRNRVRGRILLNRDGAEFPKQIRCLAETTENESWEGYNVIFFCLDEISGFTSASELDTAWKMFNTARTSCHSRATRTLRGLGMAISYPRQEEGDVILDLLKMCSTSERMAGSLAYPWISKGMHIFSGETFLFHHPRLDTFFGLEGVSIEVPIEFAGDFHDHPDDSATKYLCIPPKTAGGWIEYPEMVDGLVASPDSVDARYRPSLFDVDDYLGTATDKSGRPFRYLGKRFRACRALTQHDKFVVPRVAWLDAAKTACDAVIVIAHLEMRNVWVEGGIAPMEIVVIDDVLTWRPDQERGIQVSLVNVDKWLTEIIPNCLNIVAVGADHWNTAEVEEKLRSRGVRTDIHNLNRADYDLMKRQLYIGGMDLLPGEAAPQINNLIDVNPKKKPIKKPGFRQDVADSVCGVTRLLVGLDRKKRPSFSRRASHGMPMGISGGGQPMGEPMNQMGGPPPAARMLMSGAPSGLSELGRAASGPAISHIPAPGRAMPTQSASASSPRRFPTPVKL